jgi:hypothetical protein
MNQEFNSDMHIAYSTARWTIMETVSCIPQLNNDGAPAVLELELISIKGGNFRISPPNKAKIFYAGLKKRDAFILE